MGKQKWSPEAVTFGGASRTGEYAGAKPGLSPVIAETNHGRQLLHREEWRRKAGSVNSRREQRCGSE